MSSTPGEIAKLAITFPEKHSDQVNAKAAKYLIPRADVRQDLSVIILEKCAEFDPTKGTLEQFIFGHWEKRMRGQVGAHTYAISLDRDDPVATAARIFVESQVAAIYEGSDELPSMLNPTRVAEMLSIARFISGKSCSDIAMSFGVTPRYVRRSLQKLRETQIIPPLFRNGRRSELLSSVHPK